MIDEHVLAETVWRLVREFAPEEIILFGSQARGSGGEDSDIDLLVVVPVSQETPIQRAQRAARCLRGIDTPLDVIVRTREEVQRGKQVYASLICQAIEEGRVLYAC